MPQESHRRTPAPRSAGHLVEALSTHRGTTGGDPYTKTVWCEVALDAYCR
ncbi:MULTISPECIES: hypothetical protein [Streptomyces]|uniref:Uncharacterized protein n=1 Tax=Streptomyces galilaeus TaxID=33899 RepID=A0ABW9IHG3_STRGJ